MCLADINTPKLFPAYCRDILDILKEMGMKTEQLSKQKIPLRVLTNDRRIQGAACVLYPGMLEKISEASQKNLFILPSSVHEVILLEETGEEEPAELRRMISEVNHTQVAVEEVLSDNLYYYDRQQKSLRIIL